MRDDAQHEQEEESAIESVLAESRAATAANLREPRTLHKHRMEVARLYLLNAPIPAIADRLGTTITQIRNDIAAIEDAWRDSAITDMNVVMNRQLTRIDTLEMTYWEAWFDSREEHIVRTAETKIGGALASPMTTTRAKNEKKRDGNAEFLQGVQWCLEQRAKLLGLYAPTKIAPTTPDGRLPYDPISNETRLALLLGAYLESGGNANADNDEQYIRDNGERDRARTIDSVSRVVESR